MQQEAIQDKVACQVSVDIACGSTACIYYGHHYCLLSSIGPANLIIATCIIIYVTYSQVDVHLSVVSKGVIRITYKPRAPFARLAIIKKKQDSNMPTFSNTLFRLAQQPLMSLLNGYFD